MLRKACISIAAAAMVITGSVSAANAIQVDAGGGRWDRVDQCLVQLLPPRFVAWFQCGWQLQL